MAETYEYIETSGVIVADTSDVLDTVVDEWQTAFSAPDLTTTNDTPQGVLISAETAARTAVMQNNASVANQINPNEAGGVFLDAICAFLGLERTAESFTIAPQVPITGVPNTPIPAGSLAKTSAGDLFASAENVILSATGTATVDFVAQAGGPIPCAPGDLTNVVSMVLGWETVNNTGITSELGALEQSDASLRAERKATLALLGKQSVEAITSALTATPGITSFSFLENYTNAAVVTDGIPLVANSIWACVSGGTDLDVATALLSAKGGGCNWNGATTVNVVEPNSGQTYPVSFDRPTPVPIIYRVTVRQGSSTQDLPVTIPQSIVDYAAGVINDDPGFVVGGQASPFDVVGAIYEENPGVMVSKVEIAPASTGVYQTTEIAVAKNQQASVNLTGVVVVITA